MMALHDGVLYGRGTVWYRVVGVDMSQGNLAADISTSVSYIASQLNMEVKFGTFVQVVAPNTSVSSGAIICPNKLALQYVEGMASYKGFLMNMSGSRLSKARMLRFLFKL